MPERVGRWTGEERVRPAYAPLFFDAMCEPGALRRLQPEDVSTRFLITTHSLPITFLLDELAHICGNVTFLGIQPRSIEFFDPLSSEVRAALDNVMGCLRDGSDFTRYATMGTEGRASHRLPATVLGYRTIK